ncbi:MAG: hypothetical protein A2Y62_02055 [Candidatus Fischerbacteria bacterium RBG_13_37_8]|uniref:Uncharacterized protein n=1 Tax=Candidatus Fischerbacteria bacterium RBG_13_37_8 TaxID=1817863 RepID=A0A1F5VJL3_9BACT|nr:MAG: hypothetical protein A2Y62_02055 [Candidatus Fischerbacteria bacterium RBG_13_37_8]
MEGVDWRGSDLNIRQDGDAVLEEVSRGIFKISSKNEKYILCECSEGEHEVRPAADLVKK